MVNLIPSTYVDIYLKIDFGLIMVPDLNGIEYPNFVDGNF